MNSKETVVLGEASEESDTEEITLNDDEINHEHQLGQQMTSIDVSASDRSIPKPQGNNAKLRARSSGGLFASSLFQTASSLTKLVTYSPYDLLATQPNQPTASRSGEATSTSNQQAIIPTPNNNNRSNQIQILHRMLYLKNQQLFASLQHLMRHPLEKASKDIHTISQRLVNALRTLHEVEGAVIKINREKKNLDIDVDLLA